MPETSPLPTDSTPTDSTPTETTETETIAAALLAWYDAAAVQLPWRDVDNTYYTWLSEVMLQQTQIETVKPYFARFIDAFPTVDALAAAPLHDVLLLWEGLGYYSRARNLHRCAVIVSQEHDGRFPHDVAGLLALPGIGRYTAGAVASIAFGVRAPVVDGNVIRVLTRLYDIADDVTDTATRNRLWRIAETLLPAKRPGDYNQALMQLGQHVCTSRNPQCHTCPVSRFCQALAQGTQEARPVKPRRAPTPHYDYIALLLRDASGRILIVQRPADGLLGGLWSLPAMRIDDVTDDVIGHANDTSEASDASSAGSKPSGSKPSGSKPSGSKPSGSKPSGSKPSGSKPSGSKPAGVDGAALHRTVALAVAHDALGLQVKVGSFFALVRHGFTHFRMTIHAYNAHLPDGNDITPMLDDRYTAAAWVGEHELTAYSFGRADRTLLDMLAERRDMLL